MLCACQAVLQEPECARPVYRNWHASSEGSPSQWSGNREAGDGGHILATLPFGEGIIRFKGVRAEGRYGGIEASGEDRRRSFDKRVSPSSSEDRSDS